MGHKRVVLQRYNAARSNPNCLLRAGDLYGPDVYRRLVDVFGWQNVFILSAGWGTYPLGLSKLQLRRSHFYQPGEERRPWIVSGTSDVARDGRTSTICEMQTCRSTRRLRATYWRARLLEPVLLSLRACWPRTSSITREAWCGERGTSMSRTKLPSESGITQPHWSSSHPRFHIRFPTLR